METVTQRRGDKREQKLSEWLTLKGTMLLQGQSAFRLCQRQEGFWIPVAGPVSLESFGFEGQCLFHHTAYSTALPTLMSAPTV